MHENKEFVLKMTQQLYKGCEVELVYDDGHEFDDTPHYIVRVIMSEKTICNDSDSRLLEWHSQIASAKHITSGDFRLQIEYPENSNNSLRMTAIEAMVYCLNFVPEELEDGEIKSVSVYDCNGNQHWFAWKNSVPRMCSETQEIFSELLAPYYYSKE